MNHYEGMFLLKPDLDKAGLDKVLGQIKDAVTKEKGIVVDMKEWSKTRLAYAIKKYKEGVYYLVNFDIIPSGIDHIKKIYVLNESILRVLITKMV
jgi:small subunit ribosomal protein S6